jgi:hypothetical protein
MRSLIALHLLAASAGILLACDGARAQDVLYRCESADGISIQGTPCAKGVAQRKIVVPKSAQTATPTPPAASAPPVPAAAPSSPTARTAVSTSAVNPPAPRSGTHWVLVTDDPLRGPGEPYPLWQCMRADGSTYDSRDGVAGKQWVPTPRPDATDAQAPPASATAAALPKGPIVRPIEQSATVADDSRAPDLGPPPPGAAPGQWIADQCVKLEPQQACARYAARRDGLRKQIYAAFPSERANYAPEEQDLTRMLYTSCGM